MIKKQRSRYCFIKRYQTDFFGEIAIKGFKKKWSEDTQSYKIYFKNIKIIEKFIKDRWVNIMEKKKFRRENRGKKINKSEFFYRIDIIKLKPRRKRKTFFGLKLFRRQRMRFFSSQMTAKKYRFYLRKAGHSVSLLKKFFELFQSRFDVFLYNMNLILNGFSGHQIINHKNFMINNEIVIFPSQQVRLFDVVSPLDKEKAFILFFHRLYRLHQQFLKKLQLNKQIFLERNPKKKRFRHMKRDWIKRFYINDFFLKFPHFIETNYRIMSSLFINKPIFSEVEFPFKLRKNLRKLRYKKSILIQKKDPYFEEKSDAKLLGKFRDKKKLASKLKIPSLSRRF